MFYRDILEKGLDIDHKTNKIIDEFGNEYRNENGEIEFIESEDCEDIELHDIDKCPKCKTDKYLINLEK